MEMTTPTALVGIFKEVIDCSLIRVSRWLFEGDCDRLDFEQDADGPTTLVFDSGISITVQADTDRQGVKVSYFKRMTDGNKKTLLAGEAMLPSDGNSRFGESYEYRDVSSNSFWRPRIGVPIAKVEILKSVQSTPEYSMEFGLVFHLENGLKACLEFLDTADWPDTLRVSSSIDSQGARALSIEK